MNLIVIAQVVCAQFHGPQSRCPTCLSLEVGPLTLKVQASSLEPLPVLFLILFQYEMFPNSVFMLIYTQMYLRLVDLTFTLFNIGTKHVLKRFCYHLFRLWIHPHLGCGINVVKGGYTDETVLGTEQRLKFLFPFLLVLSFLLPLCLHILELAPICEKFK